VVFHDAANMAPTTHHRNTCMRSDHPQDQIIPLTGKLSVAVRDWEIRLVLLSHEDVRDVNALAALDGQQVRVMLLPPDR
jgi:hypothetical protein